MLFSLLGADRRVSGRRAGGRAPSDALAHCCFTLSHERASPYYLLSRVSLSLSSLLLGKLPMSFQSFTSEQSELDWKLEAGGAARPMGSFE